MRKGRSISITQWHFVTPDKPKARKRGYFSTIGVSIWTGERFVGLSPLPIFEQFPEPPTVHTTRLEFLPSIKKISAGVVSLELEKRKAALLKKLYKEEKYRAHLRWVDSK